LPELALNIAFIKGLSQHPRRLYPSTAKPWERLGNPAAAARDFYKYASSLSNY